MFESSIPCVSLNAVANANFLTEDFQKLANLRGLPDVREMAGKFAAEAGFARFALLVTLDDASRQSGLRRVVCEANTPLDYAEFAHHDDECKLDPVWRHIRVSSLPMVYDQATYTREGLGHWWEYQAGYGFGFGVATAVHTRGRSHVLFGIDAHRSPLKSSADLTGLVARTQLFASCIQVAAVAIAEDIDTPNHAGCRSGPIRLSKRELECLQWAAEGKTAWETGMILSLAEGSVAKILAHALRRLDCTSKPQAVVKALRLRLIN